MSNHVANVWIARDKDAKGGDTFLFWHKPVKRALDGAPGRFYWDAEELTQLSTHAGLRPGQIKAATITFDS